MDKTYLILYTYDKHGNGRYRTYELNTPYKADADYEVSQDVHIRVTDQGGKDALYIMLRIQSKYQFYYGQTIKVSDADKSEDLLRHLGKFIREKKEEIKTSLHNILSYDEETKQMKPPADPFFGPGFEKKD